MRDPTLGVAPSALAGGADPALPAAEAKGALELTGQGVELLRGALGTPGIAPLLGAIALGHEVGEARAILLSRAGVDHLTGVTAVDRIASAGELEDVQLAAGLADQAREHL